MELYKVMFCVFLLCAGAAALCYVETIVFGKDWWLPRLLIAICRIPVDRGDSEEDFYDDDEY